MEFAALLDFSGGKKIQYVSLTLILYCTIHSNSVWKLKAEKLRISI